jgi:hypothetical protein
MNRGERLDLNQRKSDKRVRKHLPFQVYRDRGFGPPCSNPKELRKRYPKMYNWIANVHSCGCIICKGHTRKYVGNSLNGIPLQELKERIRLQEEQSDYLSITNFEDDNLSEDFQDK